MVGGDPDWVASSLAHIHRNLRDQDVAELAAMHPGEDTLEILAQSVLLSTHGWLVFSDGEPIAVMGAAPSALPGVGIAWMLGTPGILRVGRTVARQTAQYLDAMHTAYPVLWNYIDARNTVSMKWLRWVGFELLGDRTAPSGHQFHIFARRGA